MTVRMCSFNIMNWLFKMFGYYIFKQQYLLYKNPKLELQFGSCFVKPNTTGCVSDVQDKSVLLKALWFKSRIHIIS